MLTAHVTSSVGWLGAVVAFLALAVIGVTSKDAPTVRGVYLVMQPAAWYVLVPLAFASLLTGIVISLGTTWGLFRHYWVVFKLGLPDWRAALSEIGRVLRPGGRFFFEEVTRQALNRWSYRTFLKHPTEDRFTGPEFLSALEQQKLYVSGNYVYRFFGDFIGGVACKS